MKNEPQRKEYNVKGIDILARCNWNHPDFGTFASFLEALLDEQGFITLPAEEVKKK